MKTFHAKSMPVWRLIQSLSNKLFTGSAQTAFAGIGDTINLELVLSKNKLLTLPNVDAQLHCDEGQLWITRGGDSEDYILHSGRSFRVSAKDQVVVHSLGQTRVRFETLRNTDQRFK